MNCDKISIICLIIPFAYYRARCENVDNIKGMSHPTSQPILALCLLETPNRVVWQTVNVNPDEMPQNEAFHTRIKKVLPEGVQL